MKNKRICKTLSALCLTMVVAFGFTIPAFAQGSEQAPAAPAEDSTNDSNVTVEETEPAPAAWMNSAGHRANILSANYTTLGVGYVEDGGYWTQWFIG